MATGQSLLWEELEHVNESDWKMSVHCNENPIYLLLEKELRGLSPAAPAAAHFNWCPWTM